ncbi:MAG: DNA translocase FtsK 4TM domain-containing protein [Chthoniobacterales bacterium]
MNRARSFQAWSEAVGVGLLGFGVLLFLALISYDAADAPTWLPLINITSEPNPSVQNWIGVVGAFIGGYCYFFFGIASYWLAMLIVGLGLGKMLVPKFRLRGRLGWALLTLLCVACLAELLPALVPAWENPISDTRGGHRGGAGGWVGTYLGGKALGEPLGSVGSVVVLLTLYVVSLILTTGFHPIVFSRRVINFIFSKIAALRARRLAAMNEEERILEEQKNLEKQTEKLERKLRKKAKKDEAQTAENGDEQPKLPEPKIIDSTIPQEPRKPTLAEINAQKNAAPASSGLSEVNIEGYALPPVDLLDENDPSDREATDPEELLEKQNIIIETLQQFGIETAAGDITRGPTITRYEVYPAKGVRVDRIVSLERDIARATKAERINIIAPIPGKDTVGIEIANSSKVKVTLRELFETDVWVHTKARLPIALGKDVYGNTIIGDLAQMPHCLVAGTTGSGKSVCINAIVASLLYRFTPEELRFIMIDPKVVEMQIYNTLPHLVTPVVTDPKKVIMALRWVVEEMELRYKVFAKVGVRNIATFNARPKPKTAAELEAEAEENENGDFSNENETDAEAPGASSGEENSDESSEENKPAPAPNAAKQTAILPEDDDLIIPDRMPFIVVIIDELADLMQTAPADVESAIARITQMARAAGIHMIVATQTPRADVVTGVIKANIPSRIAFQVASKIDSRVILDENGAERLLGQGDMLYLPPGTSKHTRTQGVLVTDDEIGRVVKHVSKQSDPVFEASIHEKLTSNTPAQEDISEEDEMLVERCLEIIQQERKASTSMLQRRLRLGYTRAARVVDILEQRGILGPKDGAKDREILIDLDSL